MRCILGQGSNPTATCDQWPGCMVPGQVGLRVRSGTCCRERASGRPPPSAGPVSPDCHCETEAIRKWNQGDGDVPQLQVHNLDLAIAEGSTPGVAAGEEEACRSVASPLFGDPPPENYG
eukprot:3939708-Rhodomonas_salina.2